MYWYEDEVRRLESERLKLGYQPEALFYGSSTIRLWKTLSQDFKNIKPSNLGFGGSTLAACVWFFDRIMYPYNPHQLVIYAGDNDLGDGRHPEEVFIFFLELMAKVEKRFGGIPCYYVSLKPSLSRWHMADQFKYTNNLINNEIIKNDNNWQFINVFPKMLDEAGKPQARFYSPDGLHLSDQGYKLWKDVVSAAINYK
ncbi:GDSL family lipase [Mucilaginibacter sp. RS28]|uniref:GDSL family lipase n=1 Tax=Mucilaginibacter straminoryzae TaxID=2932774 RepID=A0A9X1X110_9SPHI|nr:GDSL-type esterase/lipase family protein [Mucilaginibacter straminoryzae]MCJ8209048.1 GDSL family lipase [Mucilaginibacter straminoryzae]